MGTDRGGRCLFVKGEQAEAWQAAALKQQKESRMIITPRWKFTFFIAGTPAPGGSKTAFALRRGDGSLVTRPGGAPVINVTDAGGKKNAQWKKDVKIQARAAMLGKPPLTCPLICELRHFIRRPKAHYRTGKNAALLRDDAPKFHTQAPDAMKFGRATEDGLTGAVFGDDSQNIATHSWKFWCDHGQQSGCEVTIYAL